jgi:hypothetical protein
MWFGWAQSPSSSGFTPSRDHGDLCPTKITFGDMLDMGMRGVLIYFCDYKCSHSIEISGVNGLMTSGCPISNRGSPARHAASAAPTCGRISIRIGSRQA